jgi:hypothetical protein
MKPSDLAEYLDQDPCLEDPEPRLKDPGNTDVTSDLKLSTPVTPEPPTRAAEAERDRHVCEVMQMVMDIFPGARWTTRAEYQQAATRRDRKGRRRRG